MIPEISERLRRTMSWSVFVVACVSYLCLGWAQQGTSGSAMLEPPSSPLPFDRQNVFGLDLRQHSSLTAYQWLTSAGPLSPGLIVIPVDVDVVRALQEGEIQEAALSATDSLVAAGAGTPRRSRGPGARAAGAQWPAVPSNASRARRGSRRAAGRCDRSRGRSPIERSAGGR